MLARRKADREMGWEGRGDLPLSLGTSQSCSSTGQGTYSLHLRELLHTQMEYKYSIEQSNKEDKRHERHVLSLGHLEIKILEIERN